MKIMLSAGETSGDLHGAALARELRALDPSIALIGFGGAEMAAAGVTLRQNYTDYNVMGISAVLLNLRHIFALLDDLTHLMEEERPDVLVIIDYPDFNWRLAARAKERGIPVFSYIPPSAWAWRKGRAKSCAALADEIVAIFPHELPPYEAAGANISFVGNPLIDTVRAEMEPEEARRHFGIEENDVPILLMPGSRREEIERLLPPMLGAAEILQTRDPARRFFLPVAGGVDEQRIEEHLAASPVEVTLTHDARYALMKAARAAIAASGTVVMEAAVMGLPAVVLYRMSALSYFVGRLLVDVPRFSLPNILLGETFETELLQGAVQPERIAAAMEPIIADGEARSYVTERLARAVEMLGEPHAARRVAEKIIALGRRV
ncbi:lipid-A-disaccharide synthase [Selenomonas noxia]|uniref:Lipid-A-disaccharide synthase n=1 Tax=Selenomonas noxia F0398 TaxID=702437 RepID=A0ABN0DS95_9FIRM|nr:lipid-A-disaccharide synthase [Selenomonas noxia]EHG25865.1 lipid-A-disaccharide synthetase [Selenomonas noxia F0398]